MNAPRSDVLEQIDEFAADAVERMYQDTCVFNGFFSRVFGIYACILLHFDARSELTTFFILGAVLALVLSFSWLVYLIEATRLMRGTFGSEAFEADMIDEEIQRQES